MALAHQAKNTCILQIDRDESQKHCYAKLHPSLESTDLDIWRPFNGTKEHRAHDVTYGHLLHVSPGLRERLKQYVRLCERENRSR